MQESAAINTNDLQRLVAIIVTVFLLGIVAIMSPFAILQSNDPPPYYPPPPGWYSSYSVYLWFARYNVAFIRLEYSVESVTNLHTLPFVIMTFIYFIIQIVVGLRKMEAKYGAAIELVLFPIWVTVCQLIYGTLQDWTLIQIPIIPITGILILVVAIGINVESSLF
jgi:hypothetical protein